MDNKELKEFIESQINRIENHMDKVIESQEKTTNLVTDLRIENADIKGSFNTISSLQKTMYGNIECLKKDLAPVIVLSKNPTLLKITATGFILILLSGLYIGISNLSNFIKNDDNKIEQVQTK